MQEEILNEEVDNNDTIEEVKQDDVIEVESEMVENEATESSLDLDWGVLYTFNMYN
jgi:hypothetical protein